MMAPRNSRAIGAPTSAEQVAQSGGSIARSLKGERNRAIERAVFFPLSNGQPRTSRAMPPEPRNWLDARRRDIAFLLISIA